MQKTNLENILHKGESATHEMDAILKKKISERLAFIGTGVVSWYSSVPNPSLDEERGLTTAKSSNH